MSTRRHIKLATTLSIFLIVLAYSLHSIASPLSLFRHMTAVAGTNATSSFPVVHVVDGDTLDIDKDGAKLRIRLIGIDTPEVVDPRRPVECFGKEASNYAHALLDGTRVTIESDPSQDEFDKYGRTLAYVYLPDGRSLNFVMITEGYAHEYTYRTPYRYQAAFKAAEADARAHARGLWSPSTCGGDTTQPAK